jgi:hypothetical protein
MPGAAGSYIREIGVNPYSSNQIAIGGYDYHLQLLDLNQPKTPYVQRINMSAVIGSIKWAPFQSGGWRNSLRQRRRSIVLIRFGLFSSGQFVSFTNDEGKFFMFDTRTAIKDAAFYQHTKEVDLFCHERYSDFGVLLGYGDGTIKHIDMRVKDKMQVKEQNTCGVRVSIAYSQCCVVLCSLHSVQDPYIDAIGQIEYNAESEAIVVSGYTE